MIEYEKKVGAFRVLVVDGEVRWSRRPSGNGVTWREHTDSLPANVHEACAALADELARAEKMWAARKPEPEPWIVGEWDAEGGWCRVRVEGLGPRAFLRHEDEIKHLIPEAPDEIKAQARRAILASRPAGEDGEKTWELRADDRPFDVGDALYLREYDPSAGSYSGRTLNRRVAYVARGGLIPEGYCVMTIEPVAKPKPEPEPERERPKLDPCKQCGNASPIYDATHADGEHGHWEIACGDCHMYAWGTTLEAAAATWNAKPEEPEPLADNQIFDAHGERVRVRWQEGEPQYQLLDESRWRPWGPSKTSGWCQSGDAWFRANCPIDRFITDDGELLRFEMREDGEARALSSDGSACVWTRKHDGPARNIFTTKSSEVESIAPPLYRFRDHERARITKALRQ